jgi:hypothetical protein
MTNGLTPNLSRCSPTSKPFDDLSTKNAVRPFEAGPSVPVLAYIKKVDERGAFVILHLHQFGNQYIQKMGSTCQHFEPFNIQLSPFLTAFVRILTTSDPAFGSDIANEPMCCPVNSGPRYFFFWASSVCQLVSSGGGDDLLPHLFS